MSDQNSNDSSAKYGGDRRKGDRRATDRRQGGRRAPPPPWRRPIAYVGYGIIAALILVFIFGGDDEPDIAGTTEVEEPATEPEVLAMDDAPDRSATTAAEFERLVAEGESAVGELVEAELYCASIIPITMREMDQADPRLVELADAENRVAGADCRWSREDRSDNFLLIVPPQLAEEFARAPEVELNFVRRRRVPATLLWLGRSEALAVRIAGILTGFRASERPAGQ